MCKLASGVICFVGAHPPWPSPPPPPAAPYPRARSRPDRTWIRVLFPPRCTTPPGSPAASGIEGAWHRPGRSRQPRCTSGEAASPPRSSPTATPGPGSRSTWPQTPVTSSRRTSTRVSAPGTPSPSRGRLGPRKPWRKIGAGSTGSAGSKGIARRGSRTRSRAPSSWTRS